MVVITGSSMVSVPTVQKDPSPTCFFDRLPCADFRRLVSLKYSNNCVVEAVEKPQCPTPVRKQAAEAQSAYPYRAIWRRNPVKASGLWSGWCEALRAKVRAETKQLVWPLYLLRE